MKYHIAVVTLYGNAHVYPVLGLCSELVKRGHRVTFPTIAHWAPYAARTGAEPVIYQEATFQNVPSFLTPSPFNDQHFWSNWASMIGPMVLISAASALPQLRKHYWTDKPDLILDDRSGFLGRMLAACLGCPTVLFSPHFAPYNETFVRENGIFSNPAPILAFSRLLDCFLQSYGIKDSNNLWHTEDLNIYFIPRAFQIFGESFDDRFCFVGPCLNRPTPSAWKNNSAGRPIVLISGSQVDRGTSYFRPMIDAFSGSNYFVVLSPGANISDDAFGALPGNFEINRDISNFQIIPHTTLVISQGGTGTIMESLHFGKPAVVVPRTPLHAETGYRLAEMGLGGYLSEQALSVDSIKKRVAEILGDTSLAVRLDRMRTIVMNSGGAQLATDRIEQLLKNPRTSVE
jgi:MGT family glycosyltransferase